METLHQIFMTVIAAFVFFILIAKIATAVTNGGQDDRQRKRVRDVSKVLAEEVNSKMERSSSRRKSMKKVRFAVDHDGSLVNKVVAGPSETKQVVFEKNHHNEEIVSLNDVESVVQSPAEEYGGVEKANYDDEKPKAESVSPMVADYDQTKEGNTELVYQKSMEVTMIPNQNAAVDNNDQMCVKLPCDDDIQTNDLEETIALNDAVKSPEDEFVGAEKANCDYNKPIAESVSPSVLDYDQTKTEQDSIESINQKSSQVTIISELDNKHQMCMKLLCDDGIDESEKEKEGLISEEDDSDDDWEGVERSELEKVFAMAADYGRDDDKLQSLGSDVQMQLYGLHKVATEGPCHESQPMALKLSARSKWNAWQKLGNMDQDVAMEQYITLLSEKVPEWSQGNDSLAN